MEFLLQVSLQVLTCAINSLTCDKLPTAPHRCCTYCIMQARQAEVALNVGDLLSVIRNATAALATSCHELSSAQLIQFQHLA